MLFLTKFILDNLSSRKTWMISAVIKLLDLFQSSGIDSMFGFYNENVYFWLLALTFKFF